jgi:cytochrome c oxidase cbb3-type subunit 3
MRIFSAALLFAGFAMAQSPSQSPAARPRPKPASTETYPPKQVRAGELRFVSQCGFCHGRDAAGGESGPDLTRSDLVAADTGGDKIGPLLKTGRPDAGMPSFHIEDEELKAIAAFIHTQANKFAALGGGRRSVEPDDLATGNAEDGRVYFNKDGGCSGCHSATGDLAGIANRYRGLTLLERMLYPSGKPKAVSTLPSLSSGEDPLAAHFAQLGKYTDAEMHNVLAYLQTLK